MSCELRVVRLITPGAEAARRINAVQEVGDPSPQPVHEHGLINDISAGHHRFFSALRVAEPVDVVSGSDRCNQPSISDQPL